MRSKSKEAVKLPGANDADPAGTTIKAKRSRTKSSPQGGQRISSKECPKSNPLKTDSTHTSGSSVSSSRNETKDKAGPGFIPPKRGGFKNFFLKMTEKMGGIEKTEYTPEFTETCQDIDNYKLALEDMVTHLLRIAQKNPKYTPHSLVKMEFDYDDNENPYELLLPATRVVSALLKEDKAIDPEVAMAEPLGPLFKDFFRRGRRCLKEIRNFLGTEYEELCECRRVLNQRRQDMDYAKHELKNAKSPEMIEMKNKVYEHAKSLFDDELKKVLNLMASYPRQKETHLSNLINFLSYFRLYHEHMAIALKPKPPPETKKVEQ